jgi:hypothetical protein
MLGVELSIKKLVQLRVQVMILSLFKVYNITGLPSLIVEISIQWLLILKENFTLGEVEELLTTKVNVVMETMRMLKLLPKFWRFLKRE